MRARLDMFIMTGFNVIASSVATPASRYVWWGNVESRQQRCRIIAAEIFNIASRAVWSLLKCVKYVWRNDRVAAS